MLKSNTIKFVRAYDNFKGQQKGEVEDSGKKPRNKSISVGLPRKHRDTVKVEMKQGDKEMRKRYKDLDL